MKRRQFLDRIRARFEVNPVVALLGPRQAGKTTLARQYVAEVQPDLPRANYLDLEDPATLARLDNPRLALEGLEGLVVIDEVQRAPGLFEVLRVLVDRENAPARFLVLCSASRDLIRQSSETLAGRISFVEVTPFALHEVGIAARRQHWLRGGLPPSFLAMSDEHSFTWREDYVRTFLERDIPALGIGIPAATLRRFWLMLVHYHGVVFNASELAVSLGIGDTTVTRYLDVLAVTFMVRRLVPWFENLKKRQIKRPKVYFRDSGVLHTLLGLTTHDQLAVHPKLGASWEGYALEEIIRLHRAPEEEVYFWGVHQQAELDLLIVAGGERRGFEIKYTDAPRLTRSLEKSRDLLRLDSVQVVCPGDLQHDLGRGVAAIGLDRLVAEGRSRVADAPSPWLS
jgi:predicted AAA+ superfamily ATPase